MSTEFIDIKRNGGTYREGRTADFKEVEVHPGLAEAREQAVRCMSCGIPFCHGAGCPLSNDIQSFNAAVREDRMRDAYYILSATSPFPEFTSRICPALCEASCTAGINFEAVAVRQIEYNIIENAFKCGYVEAYKPVRRTGMRVAVIGSGPSGLAASDTLNRLGHEVTVFERNRFCGGLLRYGIPEFKLPKSLIERRLDVMRDSGIFFESGVEIGSDISAEYLRKKFDAVCLCLGTQTPRGLSDTVEGRRLSGVHFALEYLGAQLRFNSGESDTLAISAKDKNVLVIGGGDTGSDCMGTAFRQGAKSVTQVEIMPKPPLERDSSTPWPMWPYKLRTSSSHLEGGKRLWSVNLKEISGKSGRVRSASFVECDWSFDASERPKSFTERPDSRFKIEADLILLSMGFTGVGENGIVEQLGVMLTPRAMVSVNADFSINIDGVFCAGDSVSGPSLVVRAIASGKKAALSIDSYLKNHIRS